MAAADIDDKNVPSLSSCHSGWQLFDKSLLVVHGS
jgi:hypothetical protein